MKAQLVFAAILVASAIAQGTYFNGQTNNLALPTNSGFSSFSSSSSSSTSGSFSGSGSSFGSSIQTPTFPTANLNSLISGSTSSAVTAQNVASILASTKAEQSTPVTSMDTLFVKFPSKIQLGRLVDSGDGAAMIKTIQVVASDDSVPCGTKISYLLEFMGMVKYAISRKSLAIDQLITIIDGAKNQINRLQNQISRLERDRASLNIPILQSQIADLISRLESLYNQINAWKVQVDPEKARIVGFQSELKTIEKQSDDERNRISNDKLKLATTVNSIKDLEGKLRDLRDTQNALETSITRSEGIIRDNDVRLANIRNTIADIQSKIKGIQANIDGLRRQSNALQVDLERARSDLSVNKVKDNNLVNEIRALKQRINVEQTKLVDTDLRNLRAIVDNLNRAIPQIQAAIDRQYYYCYGAGKIQVETTGNTVVYVVRGDVFTQYANSAYGLNLGGANVRFNDFRFTVVDPFSPVWTSKFGSVPDSGAFGSYSCMSNGGAGSSGRGTITGISSGTITVSDGSGQTIELGLAPCSRLESTTQVPKSGQNILWKGRNSGSKNKYTLETGTCY